jgi:hypothetical protein
MTAWQRHLDGKDPSGRTVKKISTAKPYQGAQQSIKGITMHAFA